MRVRIELTNTFHDFESMAAAKKTGVLKESVKFSDADYFITQEGFRKEWEVGQIDWRTDTAVFTK